jgi:hypothetical protein
MNNFSFQPTRFKETVANLAILKLFCIFSVLFGELECVRPSFVYFALFVFLGDVWIRTQRAAVVPVISKQVRYQPSHPSPLLIFFLI